MSKEQVVLVTGAASGIGAAAMRLLVAEGHSVCAADVQEIAQDVIADYDRARLKTVRCDVSKEADCRAAVAACVERFGGLDSLLHFAGIHSTKTWEEADAEEFTRLYAVNVTGSFLMAKAAASYMKDHGGGAIVLTGSGSVASGSTGGHGRGGPAYTSTKGAVVGLHRSLARALGPHGIRVNAVSPGATATPMTAEYSPEALRRVAERTALRRMGRAEETAAVAIFLISEAASYVTGELVNVNGGASFGI